MTKYFFFILFFVFSFESEPVIPNLEYPPRGSDYIYLPMEKNHKYGDDICYYREFDEKLKYYIYYVKPCETGKYCQYEISGQPFGYCVDLQTNSTTLYKWKESCESVNDCQSGLKCENKKCVPENTCPNPNQEYFQKSITEFYCLADDHKIDDNICLKYEYTTNSPTYYPTLKYTYHGNYPGLPNECGLIKFNVFNYKDNSHSELEDDVLYRKEKSWCTIGSVSDGDFVDDKKYCYSGFTLPFYPNKLDKQPNNHDDDESNALYNLCVTPISVDIKNELSNGKCIITYKISDQNPKQYNLGEECDQTIVIESERYREFIDAFKEANDEDKKNCYNIDEYPYHCKNSNLIKLWYFYKYPEDYLFYKDRDKLKAVLDFKIQRKYPTYAFTHYLSYSYLLLLLFLIMM